MKYPKKDNLIESIKVVIFSIIICLGFSLALAQWDSPTTPPAENLSGPINVGPIEQAKGGSALKYSLLKIFGRVSSESLAVFNNSVFGRYVTISSLVDPNSSAPTKQIRVCVDQLGKLKIDCNVGRNGNLLLSVTKSGSGTGTVSGSEPSSGPGHPSSFNIDCGTSCNADVPPGTAVNLIATPSPDSVFGGWGGDCASAGYSTNCSFIMSTSVNVTAAFLFNVPQLIVVKSYYPEDASLDGASDLVTSSPSGINCGPTCSYIFNKSEQVTLTANPRLGAPGFLYPEDTGTYVGLTSYEGLTLSSSNCNPGFNVCSLTVDGTRTVTANLQVWKNVFVEILKSNGQGSEVNGNVSVTSPYPIAYGWNGFQGEISTGGEPAYTITYGPSDNPGWWDGEWNTNAQAGGMAYTPNIEITLVATPLPGHTFVGWGGLNVNHTGHGHDADPSNGYVNSCSGTNPICTITLDHGRIITAYFD